MRFLTVISFLLLAVSAFGQHPNKFIHEGNSSYKEGDYDQSVSKYRETLAIDPDNYTAAFNLGDALYRQENFAEAAQQFGMLADRAEGADQKSKAYHNLGNALLAQGNFEESIDAYKQALINDPSDTKARYNLTYAKKMLEQQQQQQEQQQDGEDNEENKDDEGDDNEDDSPEDEKENPDDDGDNDDENENPDEPKDNDQNDDEKDPNDPEKNPQQPQNNEVSKDNAEKLLNALNDLERNDQEKMRKEKGDGRAMGILKDW